GAGSLRAAMLNANQAGGSLILFATSGTIMLQSALPAIADDVYMIGPGANVLSVDGAEAYQIFVVQSPAHVEISGLTMADGYSSASGGAIENHGSLTLSNSEITGSQATVGGGIENDGTLNVIASTIAGNSASVQGGGIENIGSLTVADSTITQN